MATITKGIKDKMVGNFIIKEKMKFTTSDSARDLVFCFNKIKEIIRVV